MEVPSSNYQEAEPQPGQMGMVTDWTPPAYSPGRSDETVPRRLEWIAVILFIVNFFMMMYAVSAYYGEEAWALTMTAISTATAVVLLLSVIFSILGQMKLSKVTLVVGILGLMVSVVSLGVKLMQAISEWDSRFPY
jgi:hypothetical protein